MEKEKVIECINLEKKYFLFEKDYKIIPWLFTKKGTSEIRTPLSNINLTINQGDVIGFIGKNGAGKSTLMKLIAGITMHTDGGLIVRGKVNSLINLGAGFNPKYTGRQNIYYKGLLMGMTREEVDLIIDEIIDFCELGTYFDLPIYMYSSGMSARLGFALAIFADHDILIVDEVFSVGDKMFREKSAAKMTELFKSGKCIIFASHADEQIRQFCNRAIFIDDSRIVVDGTVDEALYAYNSKYSPDKVITPESVVEEPEIIAVETIESTNDEVELVEIVKDKFFNSNNFLGFIEDYKVDNADVFKELALFHEEEGNLEIAYKYMINAEFIKPTEEMITNKVSEYVETLGEEVCNKYEVNPEEFNKLDKLVDCIRSGRMEKADIYREIALLLEVENYLELAFKYMGYARELRPNGEFIVKRFEMYSNLLENSKK